MPSAMAQHRNKRLFQPSITSFFGNANRDDRSWSAPSHPEHSPVLPPTVQSNLLNVGMRIRKSVPQGYRNKAVDEMDEERTKIYTKPITTSYKPIELQPFCGIHKIGGMDQDTNMGADGDIPVDAQSLFQPSSFNSGFELFSSQDSTSSTFSTDSMPAGNAQLAPLSIINANTRSQKRRFEEDDDEEQEWEEQNTPFTPLEPQISPRTKYPIKHTSMPNFAVLTSPVLAARKYAHPTSRARRKEDGTIMRAEEFGMMGDVEFDFGEAEFLRPLEGDEMDVET